MVASALSRVYKITPVIFKLKNSLLHKILLLFWFYDYEKKSSEVRWSPSTQLGIKLRSKTGPSSGEKVNQQMFQNPLNTMVQVKTRRICGVKQSLNRYC